MTSKYDFLDAQNVIERYQSGETLQQIAAELRTTVRTLKRYFSERDVRIRTKAEALALGGRRRRQVLQASDVVPPFRNGVSLEAIAQKLGVHERVVRRTLQEAGIRPRTRSEAMALRMSRTSLLQRQRLTAAARTAAKISGNLYTPETVRKARANRAKTLHRTGSFVGWGEKELATMLIELGVTPEPQLPVDGYNIDLAIHPIAVEVHVAANNPMTDPRLHRRAVHLLNRDWGVLYVWVTGAHPVRVKAAEKAVALLQLAKTDRTDWRKCRVIRGSGEDVACYCRNPDHGSLVETAVDLLDLP